MTLRFGWFDSYTSSSSSCFGGVLNAVGPDSRLGLKNIILLVDNVVKDTGHVVNDKDLSEMKTVRGDSEDVYLQDLTYEMMRQRTQNYVNSSILLLAVETVLYFIVSKKVLNQKK